MLNRQHFINSVFHEDTHHDADMVIYRHRLEEWIDLNCDVDKLWINWTR